MDEDYYQIMARDIAESRDEVIRALRAALEAKQVNIDRLREALQFFADEKNWDEDSCGSSQVSFWGRQFAKKALNET